MRAVRPLTTHVSVSRFIYRDLNNYFRVTEIGSQMRGVSGTCTSAFLEAVEERLVLRKDFLLFFQLGSSVQIPRESVIPPPPWP